MKRYVFDSFAVIAFFEDESGAAIVESALREVVSGKAQGWMSVINWGEVYYSTYREQGLDAAESVVAQLAKYPIQIVQSDMELTKSAALLKGKYRVAYADCFAAALSKQMKARLITGDPEFRLLENETEVLWMTEVSKQTSENS